MPYMQTICRARAVAFSRSFSAPLLTSLKMISSAARPPSSPQAVDQFGLREQELLFGRQLHGVAQGRTAAGHDADLMQTVGVQAIVRNQGMSHFVIGDAAFLLLFQSPAVAFGAGHDLFDGVFQVESA